MFALTCPHCQAEVKTKFARPGATVKCTQCQQTYLLDARNTRALEDPAKTHLLSAAGTPMPMEATAATGEPAQGAARSESKLAMAAMREMAQEMGELVPEVDIYAPAENERASKNIKLILAVTLLVLVLVGSLWLIATTPAIRDLFKSSPTPAPRQPAPPAHHSKPPDGTTPASDF